MRATQDPTHAQAPQADHTLTPTLHSGAQGACARTGCGCIRTKTSDGNNVASSICETGGYETQCLSDSGGCDFVNMDDSSSLGECEAQYLSAEGAAAAGMLIGGALIAVIVVPILAVLICGGILLGVCIWCCCCKDKKKPPAADPSSGVEIKNSV